MKNKDKKHHESTIGKIIYGFMLFAPLFAIASTCLIYSFNKEIHTPSQSVEIEYKYESNEVETEEDLVLGNIYNIKFNDVYENMFLNNDPYISLTIIEVKSFSINRIFTTGTQGYIDENIEINNTKYENATSIIDFHSDYIWFGYCSINLPDNYLLGGYIENMDYQDIINYNIIAVLNSYENINFNNIEFSKVNNNDIPIESVEVITEQNPTEKVFYRAVDYVEDSNIFNWAKNSLIYTGLVDTCLILSINNTFIPMLLAYWLIISILYFLYDIVLMILQVLHRKIHELQETF